MLMPKAPKRAHYVMVDEDDPQWKRFWDAYPVRRSKKDARKAWAKLRPTPALVDQMVTALAWQARDWAKKADWYTPPLPATWLNGARWEDEPPPQVRRMMSDAAASVFDVLGVKL